MARNGKGNKFTRGEDPAKLVVSLSHEEMDKFAKAAVSEERTPAGQVRLLIRKYLERKDEEAQS